MAQKTKRPPLYGLWADMKTRCYNPKYAERHLYGGRGIKVCDRWLDKTQVEIGVYVAGNGALHPHRMAQGFLNFVEDMGERPSNRYSLDRIDVNGDYSPENCKWVDWYVQAANRRNSSHHVGVSWDNKSQTWQARLMIHRKTVFSKYFKDLDEAIIARKEAEKVWL